MDLNPIGIGAYKPNTRSNHNQIGNTLINIIEKSLEEINRMEIEVPCNLQDKKIVSVNIQSMKELLPVEILVNIFALLSLKEIPVCFLICKSWTSACEDEILWKNQSRVDTPLFGNECLNTTWLKSYKSFVKFKYCCATILEIPFYLLKILNMIT